jgi:hypothetical protein
VIPRLGAPIDGPVKPGHALTESQRWDLVEYIKTL